MQLKKTLTEELNAYRLRTIVRYTMGLLTGLVGVVNMVSAIIPRLNWDVFFGAWPLDSHHGTHKLIAISGFFLIMLFNGLMRGKRQAWSVAVVLLLLSAFLYFLNGGPVLTSIITPGLAVLLVGLARFFRARSDPPSVWRGYIAFLVGLSIVTLYTVGGLFFLYNKFEPLVEQPSFEKVILLLLSHSHIQLTKGTAAFFFERVLPGLCLSAVIYGIVSVLRPVAAVLHPNEREKKAASILAHIYGTNSISYFALEAGKSYFFSASRRSVISYVLEGNVAVVAGDPIGPEEEMLPAIQQFVAYCQEQDWMIVFWQVRDSLIDLYRLAGLHMLKMGEDAIINTRTFTLAGKALANVRSSVKRAEKEGLHVVFYHGDVQDAERRTQIERISQAWLASKGESEKGFSMGRFDPRGDPELVTALAVDTTNKVHAFVTFVPIYGRNGWGLDLMRRSEQASPGTMELLLARSIEYFKCEGADMVSLGLAPLNNISQTDKTFLDNSIDFLTHLFGNQSKNQSLFNFKKKFQPCWESRYLIFSNTLKLPKAGWAIYHAHQRDVSLLIVLCRFLRECQAKHQAMRRTKANA
jgi:phosphatidylglycerol lysyltransferase